MTCIVGIETQDGRVMIAGDMMGSNGHAKANYAQPKVYEHSKMIFGYTTSYRFGQVVELLLDDNTIYIPEKPSEVYGWLVRKFIPQLQKAIDDSSAKPGMMLIGLKGQLWKVQDDYSVLRPTHGFDSVGSGEAFAIGSMYTQVTNLGVMPKNLVDAESVLRLAIETAGTLCVSVSTECTTVSI